MYFARRLSIALLTLALVAPSAARADSAPGGTVGSRLGFAAGVVDWNAPDITAEVDGIMAGIAATGAKWVRFDMAWWDIQCDVSLRAGCPGSNPDPATWNWATADLFVDRAVAHGLSIVANPNSAPCWAAGLSSCEPWSAHLVAANANDYQHFLTQLGVRYLDRVTTWELWNEPNVPAFFGPNPNPQTYVQRVLVPGATGLRAAQTWLNALTGLPHPLRILTGGTAPSDTGQTNGVNRYSPLDFLAGVYQYGGRTYFDAVAHHPYSFPYPPETVAPWNAFTQTDDLHGLMDAQGDGTKLIWATEIGFPTEAGATSPTGACPDDPGPLDKCVDEDSQAGLADLAMRAWIGRTYTGPMIWFAYKDGLTGISSESKFGWGVVRGDLSWKPARLTMQAEASYPIASVGPLTSVVEGGANTRNLATTVSLSSPYAPAAIALSCDTADGSAVHPSDFTAKTDATLSIAKNATANFLNVVVKGDGTFEPDEYLVISCASTIPPVTCSAVPLGTTGQQVQSCALPTGFPAPPFVRQAAAFGVILSDDPQNGATEVSIGDAWILEGDVDHATKDRNLYLTVASSKIHKDATGTNVPITVDVTVSGGTGPGQATLGADFTAPSSTVTIAKGATTIRVQVPIVGDLVREPNETFTVTIANPSNGAVIRRGTASALIVDDDY